MTTSLAVGYLPCFSRYRFDRFPIINFYQDSKWVTDVKNLLGAFIDCKSPYDLSRNHGIGKQIQPIRPESREAKEIIKWCAFPEGDIYRIDYGNTTFKIVFGLLQATRTAYILGIDTKHDTFYKRHF